MLSVQSALLSKWFLLALGTLLLVLPACSSNAGAEQPPVEPTMGVQPGVAPGQATPTRDTTPRPTLLPGDPNQPVSNETAMPAQNQNTTNATVSGQVTDANHQPIPRARLAFSKSSVPMPDIAYVTNAQGNFKMNVPRGKFTLTVFADGYASQERELDTRQESQVQIDFVLEKQ